MAFVAFRPKKILFAAAAIFRVFNEVRSSVCDGVVSFHLILAIGLQDKQISVASRIIYKPGPGGVLLQLPNTDDAFLKGFFFS